MPELAWDTILPKLLTEAGIEFSTVEDMAPLTGGVSSDIVRFRTDTGREYCAKRALEELKVEQEWKVPLERNAYEVAWLRKANVVAPGSAPQVVADSAEQGLVILEYLPPDGFSNWKKEMLAGNIDPQNALTVGKTLGALHRGTLLDPEVERNFKTDALFDALRLDPYLRFTAGVHGDLAEQLLEIIETTATTKMALVHGDFSPKNILISRDDGRAVILDAECAWYGDPAFDAAFCLNHFLLKAAHMPDHNSTLIDCAGKFFNAWIRSFDQSMREALDQRVANLLPCLLLARIDGKSPAEYLTENQRYWLREVSRDLIQAELNDTESVLADFSKNADKS